MEADWHSTAKSMIIVIWRSLMSYFIIGIIASQDQLKSIEYGLGSA